MILKKKHTFPPCLLAVKRNVKVNCFKLVQVLKGKQTKATKEEASGIFPVLTLLSWTHRGGNLDWIKKKKNLADDYFHRNPRVWVSGQKSQCKTILNAHLLQRSSSQHRRCHSSDPNQVATGWLAGLAIPWAALLSSAMQLVGSFLEDLAIVCRDWMDSWRCLLLHGYQTRPLHSKICFFRAGITIAGRGLQP